MNCLKDYIGLTGCGNQIPASGLFVNSLPGISLKSVEFLADAEQGNFLGVWEDVQTRALKRFELLVNSEFSKEYKIKSTKYTIKTKDETFGLFPYSQITLNNKYVAILIESNCGSELNFHNIQSIFFRGVNIPTSISYGIYDFETLNYLDGGNAFCASNINEIVINKKFYCHKLLIKLSENTDTYYTNTETNKIYSDCVDITFGTIDSNYNFTSSNLNYGFNILYSNKCDWSSICCYNKEAFAIPLWYLLGSELMMERMVSDRINKYTVDKKQAEELKAYYDSEFDRALKQAISGISLESCDCCLECDPLIAIREVLP